MTCLDFTERPRPPAPTADTTQPISAAEQSTAPNRNERAAVLLKELAWVRSKLLSMPVPSRGGGTAVVEAAATERSQLETAASSLAEQIIALGGVLPPETHGPTTDSAVPISSNSDAIDVHATAHTQRDATTSIPHRRRGGTRASGRRQRR